MAIQLTANPKNSIPAARYFATTPGAWRKAWKGVLPRQIR
jgi:hypothetical protein